MPYWAPFEEFPNGLITFNAQKGKEYRLKIILAVNMMQFFRSSEELAEHPKLQTEEDRLNCELARTMGMDDMLEECD